MLFKKLKKWQKCLIGASSGAMVATAVIAPISIMTSCSKEIKFVDFMDRQYEVSSASYNSMKNQLRSLYKKKIEWLPASDQKAEMETLERTLSGFDNKLTANEYIKETAIDKKAGEEPTSYINYTVLTSSLIKYADTMFDIKLNRHSTATWQQLQDAYDGYRDACEIYMRHIDMPVEERIAILQEADTTFGNIRAELHEKYGDDALSGLEDGIPQLINCFESTNLDIAALAASNRLKQLFEKFTFVFKERKDNLNRYDIVLPKLQYKLEHHEPLDEDLMTLLFDCIEAKSGYPYTYSEQMVPGFTISPMLTEIKADPYKNEYMISIDWSIISNKIKNNTKYSPEQKELATGHIYGNNPIITGGGSYPEDKPIAEILHDCEIQTLDYQLYPTAAYEAKQIKNAYFNSSSAEGCIDFKWNDNPQSPDNKYEYFFEGIKDKESKGKLNIEALARSGLLISHNKEYYPYEKVSNILKRVADDAAIDEEALTLSEQFIRYCDVESDVSIEEPKQHLVTNQFSVCYKNSDAVNLKSEDRYYREIPMFHNDHYLVSPEFFEQANEAFNHAYNYVVFYRDLDIEAIKSEVDDVLCDIIASSVKTVLYTAYYTVLLVSPIPLPNVWDSGTYTPKPNLAFAIALCVTEAVLLGGWIAATVILLVNPLKDCVKRNRQFAKEDVFRTLTNRITQDTKWFSLKGKDDKCDPDDYKNKYQNFAIQDFEETCRPLYQFYTNFNRQEVTKKFQERIDHYEIDTNTILSITNKFALPVGPWNMISLAYMILEFGISCILSPTVGVYTALSPPKFIFFCVISGSWKELWMWAKAKGTAFLISLAIGKVLYQVTRSIKPYPKEIYE